MKRITPGKKTKAWNKARKKLKKQFEEMGVTICELQLEGCWRDNTLGFAHIDKRRHLKADELDKVVLACGSCHDRIEKLPRAVMRRALEQRIKRRHEVLSNH